MKTFIVFAYTIFYLLWSLFFRIKLFFLRKFSTYEKSEKYVYKTVTDWSRRTIKLVGAKVDVEGLENIPEEGSCLFVSNHQGIFDFLAIMAYIGRPVGFIAKKEIKKVPVVSKWMEDMHCIFLNRESLRESLKEINLGIENIKHGNNMLIFPEGTRSRSSRLGEFKKGSLRMALKTNVPIVPITMNGSYKVFEANGNKVKKENVSMIVGKPIYTKKLSLDERKDLVNIVRNAVAENIIK